MEPDVHEYRIRVTCNLPINNSREEKAAKSVVGYLKDLRTQSVGVSGFTHSEWLPSVFQGYWWDSDGDRWIEDRLALFIVDYKIRPADSYSELDKVNELRTAITSAYARYGAKQDEVWVVSQRILRHA